MQELLGPEAEEFLMAMDKSPVTSVRLNNRKPGADFPGATRVKWCDSGFYLPERPQFVLDPLLHAGAYYVQDASSMIYQTLAEIIAGQLKKNNLKVLDLCAAPGGKTTAMINGLPDGADIVANEISVKRVGALRENLCKWGYRPVKVTNRDSYSFAEEGEIYDIVAVDAPCSGEGMMRKDEDARSQWSPALIAQCAALQKEILSNAVQTLKPGGFLIYSTCTFNREENELNAEFIKNNLGLVPFDPEFPVEWGIMNGLGTDLPVYRFMPHHTNGEGLFVAVFKKNIDAGFSEGSVPDKNLFPRAKNDLKDRNGKDKKAHKNFTPKTKELDVIPEIDRILEIGYNDEKYPKVELSLEEARCYLRRESLRLSRDIPAGIIIVTYKGLPLGPAKNIGSRINNLYPKAWRVLQR